MTVRARELAVVALSTRLLRRGAVILAGVTAAYVAVEVVSYEQSYPTEASRARLASFQDNPGVRLLQGVAHDVDTTGGFVAWDGGWFLQTMVGIWILLAVMRLTRADEDSDRSALVLVAPLPARRVLGLQMLTLTAAGALNATACAVVLVVLGVTPSGAALFSLGLAGFAATIAGLAALSAQLFDVRRRAVGAASGVLAATYLVRMVGNGTDSWTWLRWLSPYGWMDNLRPYGDPSWAALALLLAVPLALGRLAGSLRGRRDTGAGILPSSDSRTARTWALGSSTAFAWRSSRGVLLAWALGLAAYAALIGSLLPSLADYLLEDPDLRRTLSSYGIEVGDITKGMVGFMSVVFGLAFALFACWRIGAARNEEDAGRADLMLVRPLTRAAWLGGYLALATVSVPLLATTTGIGLWLGGWAAGADLRVGAALSAVWSTVPVALLLAGLAVLVLGTRPRLTVTASVSTSVLAYLLPTVGRALGLPIWVRDLSPFQHLAVVPVDPYAWTSGVVMLAGAAALMTIGVLRFVRRDITLA